MKELEYRQFLRRKGKKESVVVGLVDQVRRFETYLEQGGKKSLDYCNEEDIQAFLTYLEQLYAGKARTMVRGIALYFQFINRSDLAGFIFTIREGEVQKIRKSFKLSEFRGVKQEHIHKLGAVGIRTVNDMLVAGCTPELREGLAHQTGIPQETILELVKLSDLARLAGVKAIRARLYYDAGVDCLETMAHWDADEMRLMLIDFVRRTGFDGIAPLPKEASNSVESARKLPKILVL